MFDVDTYRANAQHCLRMAEDPLNWERKQTWLNMAETWLGMIPQPQRRPEGILKKLSGIWESSRSLPGHGISGLCVKTERLCRRRER